MEGIDRICVNLFIGHCRTFHLIKLFSVVSSRYAAVGMALAFRQECCDSGVPVPTSVSMVWHQSLPLCWRCQMMPDENEVVQSLLYTWRSPTRQVPASCLRPLIVQLMHLKRQWECPGVLEVGVDSSPGETGNDSFMKCNHERLTRSHFRVRERSSPPGYG